MFQEGYIPPGFFVLKEIFDCFFCQGRAVQVVGRRGRGFPYLQDPGGFMEEEEGGRVVYLFRTCWRGPEWFNLFCLGASGYVPHSEEGSSGGTGGAACLLFEVGLMRRCPGPMARKAGPVKTQSAGVHVGYGCFHATKADVWLHSNHMAGKV